ncbi:hypothetical protein [Streptosporangium roseum]|uniref:hypothetical protein n=1 Tax=Streptosporangium roseum TaxID=2001 RepID=UPI0001A3DD1A|nr:hypothetical protein [Streptosporangium roseum]
MARIRAIVERWGIEFPAVPGLDIEGLEVDFLDPEDIIPVFRVPWREDRNAFRPGRRWRMLSFAAGGCRVTATHR